MVICEDDNLAMISDPYTAHRLSGTAYVLCIAGGKSTLLVGSRRGQVRSGSALPRGTEGAKERGCVYV